jgi:hypothetical protein
MPATTARATSAIAALMLGVSTFALAAPADAATRTEVKRMVIEEARNSIVPPALALAVAKVESDFQDRVLSHKGARGVMQIMPATARGEFGVDAEELWDPRLNVQLGIDFLERLHAQYGGRWELALSHYNGGTLKGGTGADAKPHGYTRKYVADVTRWWQRYQDQADVWGSVVAAADKNDAWVPARTKIASANPRGEADPKSNGDIEYELKAKVEAVQVLPTIVSAAAPALRARVRWHDPRTTIRAVEAASAKPTRTDSAFWNRVSQARNSLDDFSPRTKWVRG